MPHISLHEEPELRRGGGGRGMLPTGLAFQRAPEHVVPTWPDSAVQQQTHLDVMVEDVAAATPRCHLYRFAVRPDRRRQGIGGSLLAAAEERFAGFGGHRADAMVLAENEIAHSAWAASGYAPEPEWARWVKPLR